MAAVATVVHGTVRAPGDKSISHRALILSALARGKSRISNILESADVQSTAKVLRALGADVPPLSSEFLVTGQPPRFLRDPPVPLDCGNSGTTARLMAGVVAGVGINAKLVGDASLSRRPMRRVAEPLTAMGGTIALAAHGGLPLEIFAKPLHPIEWNSPIASAQVKSAVLLAALFGGVQARVREPHLSRDHTERMLAARGVALHLSDDGRTVDIEAGQVLRPVDVSVPADPSSAAFFVALALLASDGELRLSDVCLNPTRTGFYRVLERMNADVSMIDVRDEGGERVGTLVARPSRLRGITISAHEVPAMIDELPLLACLAARADGVSEVRGAGELRVKESDRIATIVANLRELGVAAEELEDGFVVEGTNRPLRGTATTNGDHRIAMCFGVLGALSGNSVLIDDPACVDISYPGFWQELQRVVG
ncbi:MAG TPA: 3-phosphoshikimate 1-carboxyvinyltransferase [Gemmatimonadaceae bacterium]|nr:3-phosphoshikimate 1-carboxyvinyltransferase [Gemmatimonadaceae bacterium]